MTMYLISADSIKSAIFPIKRIFTTTRPMNKNGAMSPLTIPGTQYFGEFRGHNTWGIPWTREFRGHNTYLPSFFGFGPVDCRGQYIKIGISGALYNSIFRLPSESSQPSFQLFPSTWTNNTTLRCQSQGL